MDLINFIFAVFVNETFIQNYLLQKPVVIDLGTKFPRDVGVYGAEEIIRQHVIRQRKRIKVITGETYESEFQLTEMFPGVSGEGLIDAALAQAQLSTFILFKYERLNPFYRKLALALAEAYQSATYALTAFAAINQTLGAPKHADTGHVFAFVDSGAERWQVWSFEGEPLLDKVVHPGRVIYIPPLCWHYVERKLAPAVHITIELGFGDFLKANGFVDAAKVRIAHYKAACTNPLLRQMIPPGKEGDEVISIFLAEAEKLGL